jgi:hypothetical protein
MVKNLLPQEIHHFIVSDFKGTWNSIADNSDQNIGRGNLMFARQAMNLLEFAARLCDIDTSGKSIQNFSTDLCNIEPKYFTFLPGICAVITDFVLPYIGSKNDNSLLCVIFDLIRHELGHQYQQIVVDLNNGKHFYISLTGATYRRYLYMVSKSQRPQEHLAYTFDQDGDLELKIYPDILFLDFEKAIDKSALLKKNLSFPYLSRPKSKGSGKHYNFDTKSLEKSLIAGKHIKL